MSDDQLFQRLRTGAARVPEQRDNPFTLAYFTFLDYFHTLDQIAPEHVIIGANFTYGWMPTMLRLRSTDIAPSAAALNRAKAGERLTDTETQTLISLINNSIVGVSKLLHFVNPQQYAIWDSRVATFYAPHLAYDHFQRPSTYRAYLDQCISLSNQPGFPELHRAVAQKVGRPITALRAIELIMYENGLPAIPTELIARTDPAEEPR
jgi:hypothetical protein